jgi:UDP-glucose 4-epimerase
MARCLVTGHKGYIGSRLFQVLKGLGHEVAGIDIKDGNDINSPQGFQEDDDGKFHPRWFSFSPEYIFHLACYPRIGYSIENPVGTMLNNVMAGTNVLNFARKVGAKRVIYSSSSSILGQGRGPANPYALQKMVTEIECRLYSELYGLETVGLRYFNVYSEEQRASGAYATAVSNWMQFIREGKVPFITGEGSQRRDMLHLEDTISANIFAMEYKGSFNGAHYDVGTGKNISLNEIKETVLQYFNNMNFMYVTSRPNEVQETLANIVQLQSLGWKAEINIENGINRCFAKLKKELEDV